MGAVQIYDSPEALKKFEPHYRQVRYGLASKIEKASRQQRTWWRPDLTSRTCTLIHGQQASSARIVQRSCEAQRRSRARRRRRESKRWHDLWTWTWCCKRGRGDTRMWSCSILAPTISADVSAYIRRGNGVRLWSYLCMVEKMRRQ
jgi:hypothetical protein